MAIAALALVGATSACGVRADIAASGGADVCRTLAAVRTDVESLPRGRSAATVGDIRTRLTEIERTLWTAQQQADGLAHVLIGNLHLKVARAAGSMSDLSDSSPVESLPRHLRNSPTRVKGGFVDAWDKLACA